MTRPLMTEQDYADADALLLGIWQSLSYAHRLIVPHTGMKSPIEGRLRTAALKVYEAMHLLAGEGRGEVRMDCYGAPEPGTSNCTSDPAAPLHCTSPFHTDPDAAS